MSNQNIDSVRQRFLLKCKAKLEYAPVPVKFRASALSFLALILIALPTHAQEINAAGAAHLQTLFQNTLDQRQQNFAARENGSLEIDGPVTVEPADTYYAITWPQMTISRTNGDTLKIGLITMNAAPHSAPGQYKITTALPSPLIGKNANGRKDINIAIGAQNIAGIFDEKLNNFIKMDAQLSDIRIILDSGEALATIPSLKVRFDLSQDESENDRPRWSGPSHFEISDFSLTQADKSAQLTIEKFVIASTFKSFAAEAFGTAVPTKDAKPALSPLKFSDGASMTIALTNLSASPADKEQKLTLQSGSFGFSYQDALSGNAIANASLSFTGLNAGGAPEDLQALLPQNGDINLTQHNIPLRAIDDTLANSGAMSGKILSLPLLFKIPAILAQAGSYLEAHDSNLENNEYHIDFSSILRADLTAVNSATATGTLRFAGLDKVLSRAQVIGTNLHGSPYAMPMRHLARNLERLKPLGRVETDAEKGFIHVFDLEMNQQGQFLINGQSADALLKKPQEPQPDVTPPAPQDSPL